MVKTKFFDAEKKEVSPKDSVWVVQIETDGDGTIIREVWGIRAPRIEKK